DLDVEVGDLLLDFGDLHLQRLLLKRVVLERVAELLLGRQRIGEVAAELRTDLVDQRLLLQRIGRRRVGVGSKRAGAQKDECERQRESEALHDSRCLRRLTSDAPDPRLSPTPNTIAAARAATVAVMPGANIANDDDPAAMPVMASPNVTAPATPPAMPPVMAPSTTKGPRTIQRGAPTSCMIETSSRRE